MDGIEKEPSQCIRCEVRLHGTERCIDANLKYCLACRESFEAYKRETTCFKGLIEEEEPASVMITTKSIVADPRSMVDSKLTKYFNLSKKRTEGIDLTGPSYFLEKRQNPHHFLKITN